jgi:hypothetical protein
MRQVSSRMTQTSTTKIAKNTTVPAIKGIG